MSSDRPSLRGIPRAVREYINRIEAEVRFERSTRELAESHNAGLRQALDGFNAGTARRREPA